MNGMDDGRDNFKLRMRRRNDKRREEGEGVVAPGK